MPPPHRPKTQAELDQKRRDNDRTRHRQFGASGRSARAHSARGGPRGVGLDVLPGPFTDVVGSIADRVCGRARMAGVDAVLHAATLHKPHVATHAREAFVDTNVRGTLTLLEEAARARVRAFVMTSTTSAFGDALKPPPGSPRPGSTRASRRPEEHLRRDQDRRRGPLPAVPPQRGPGGDRA